MSRLLDPRPLTENHQLNASNLRRPPINRRFQFPLAQVIGSPDVGASFVDLFQLPDLDISPASATFEEPVINREQPSESVTEETSIDFDDLHLFKYSETPITSKTTYIPTVFDSTYYNPRYCDLWAIGEGSQEYIRSQMVIAGIRTDIQAWRKDKDFDKSQDEIKIKDLREESGVHAGLGANVSIQDTPGKKKRCKNYGNSDL